MEYFLLLGQNLEGFKTTISILKLPKSKIEIVLFLIKKKEYLN